MKRTGTPLLKQEVQRVEKLVPTWTGILPIYEQALMRGTPAATQAARSELRRMAKAADQWNEEARKLNGWIDGFYYENGGIAL